MVVKMMMVVVGDATTMPKVPQLLVFNKGKSRVNAQCRRDDIVMTFLWNIFSLRVSLLLKV